MLSISSTTKSRLQSIGKTILTIFVAWMAFSIFIDGVPTDSAEGLASGFFYCDPDCQERITLSGGKPDLDRDIVVYAMRGYLSCKYYSSSGWSIRNYWQMPWAYERADENPDFAVSDALISREGIPVIEYDWDSYLPMKEIARDAECPDHLDGNLDKKLWDTPVMSDKVHVNLIEEKDWATDYIKYDEWKNTLGEK